MSYIQRTPFRRPKTCAQIKPQTEDICTNAIPVNLDKWKPLHLLAIVRETYGLSDRDLTVLQALISFHGGNTLTAHPGSSIVYASNKTLSMRLNGMPNSTLRRHLAKLVAAQVIARRDSPNGKRYVRRAGGEITAYGFDLTPLLYRFTEFELEAERIQLAQAQLKTLREIVMLMLRDLSCMAEDAQNAGVEPELCAEVQTLLKEARTLLRRKPERLILKTLKTKFEIVLLEFEARKPEPNTSDLSASPVQNERHQQSKDTYTINDLTETPADPRPAIVEGKEILKAENRGTGPNKSVTLKRILNACPEISIYAQDRISNWRVFCDTAASIVPMLGIDRKTWASALEKMGSIPAAITVALILERFEAIENPDSYLATLTRKFTTVNYDILGWIEWQERLGTSSQL